MKKVISIFILCISICSSASFTGKKDFSGNPAYYTDVKSNIDIHFGLSMINYANTADMNEMYPVSETIHSTYDFGNTLYL